MKPARIFLQVLLLLAFLLISSGCIPNSDSSSYIILTSTPTATLQPTQAPVFPQRPHYDPGQLVDYTVQSGDTLPVLAIHFNTTVEKIRQANPSIPEEVTTLPPGMPMQIPIYYLSLWGPSYQILPDSLFVDGSQQSGFDTQAFIDSHSGWLKGYTAFAFDGMRTAGEIIDYIAINYSISPRLILALIEYQAGGLSLSSVSQEVLNFPLGYRSQDYVGLYMQLNWAANRLNNGYYSYRIGDLTSFTHLDGTMERPDPWQNAATVSLQSYFSCLYDYNTYLQIVSENGLAQTYTNLFGDPWENVVPVMEGNLQQPQLLLPFVGGQIWAYTGGPHTNWGSGAPWTSLDFAPPSSVTGCDISELWTTAVAAGTVVRVDDGIVALDLDGDGDEHTGWVIFYLHIAAQDKVKLGTVLNTGDPVGHPSCEGGHATGTHVHIARKYNGEWIPAAGTLAFDLEGWIAFNGDAAYAGTLQRNGVVVTASTNAVSTSLVQAEK
jgi:LasA protease